MAELKSINGLASANIKSINGLAIASVKSFNGLLIPSTGWDISTMSYIKNKYVGGNDYSYGLFFKDDGTKMYISNSYDNYTYQYSLSTAWDVSTASYDSTSGSWGMGGLFFKPDGTKMYITRNSYIRESSLSTTWDVSTTGGQGENNLSSQFSSGFGLFFKPDGTKMYISDNSNKKVYQYSLSTAWSTSTASYDNKYYSFSTENQSTPFLFFKPDGTKMYISDYGGTIYQYSLSTAWDVSTASYDSTSGSDSNYLRGFYIKSDGKSVYTVSRNGTIYQYSLT